MRPVDYEGPDDPGDARDYLDALHAWEDERDDLAAAQAEARATLDAAQQRATITTDWVSRLTQLQAATAAHADALRVADAAIAEASAAAAVLDGDVADYAQAHEVATARLLGGPAVSAPLALLPLRLQTAWQGTTLNVRIYPDVIGVDGHDAGLTDSEQAAGERYWAIQATGLAVDVDQAWAQLARAVGGPRAAYIVTATDPAGRLPARRNSAWAAGAHARLLPDRFAVVAYAGGEPLDVGPPDGPPRYVTWSADVPGDLDLGLIDAPSAAGWMVDFATAQARGMAVSLTIPSGSAPIDALLVVGVRAAQADLAALLDAHAFSDGLEILADGTPTNNSGDTRAAFGPDHEAVAARALVNAPAPLAAGSAGDQLAGLLGIAAERLSTVAGAVGDRGGPAAAMRTLVGDGVTGAIAAAIGPDADAIWPLVAPGGAGPTMRIGRQPYGVAAVSALGRWQARDGEASDPLAPRLREWGQAAGPTSAIDPGAPPQPLERGTPRRAGDDVGALAALLLESASSVEWAGEGEDVSGLEALAGPAEGDEAAAVALARLAATAPDDVRGGSFGSSLLAYVAVSAKLRPVATVADAARRDDALRTLAAFAGDGDRRGDLARLLTETLDAASHRFDAWIGAAVDERLRALRAARAPVAVGAYGWLTDLEPRPAAPRSLGHIHAPSLAHAATAAVLRSGYDGERRRDAARAVNAAAAAEAQAQAVLDEAGRNAHRHELLEPEPQLQGRPNPAHNGWAGQQSLLDMQVRAAQAAVDQAHAALLHGQATLDGARDSGGGTRRPLAVDLSSARVRVARRLLAAVRAGQPLAAVLGYEFERDLSDAGLQRYLAAFRKLTRFHTGTALEALEETRSRAQDALAAAQAQLATLEEAGAQTGAARDGAAAALEVAQAQQRQAEDAAAPALALQNELSQLDTTTIPQLVEALNDLDSSRPAPGDVHFKIKVPVV